MDETKEKEITEAVPAAEAAPEISDAPVKAEPPRGDREFRKNVRKPARREARVRVKPEFDNKLLEIRRVARVVSGGRRFSFSATLVVGDRKGKVGVGIGKAGDTPIAIEKAMRDGKKNMVTIKLTDKSSIPHAVEAKYGASRLMITPAPGK
jgi:small subunit ribosomal protein S5